MDFPSQWACPDALTLCSQAERQRLWLADYNQIPLQVIQPACCQAFEAGREAACQSRLLQNCILPYYLVIQMLTNVFLIFHFGSTSPVFKAQRGFWLKSQITIHGAQRWVSRSVRCGHNQHQDCCEGLRVPFASVASGGTSAPLHSKMMLLGPEHGRSCLSSTRKTSRFCSSSSSRCRVRDIESFTSLENSSMRKKNEQKSFWDEHIDFPKQWLESLAICTSNSCRIFLGRNKCILHDVMPCDRRFCVETVEDRHESAIDLMWISLFLLQCWKKSPRCDLLELRSKTTSLHFLAEIPSRISHG